MGYLLVKDLPGYEPGGHGDDNALKLNTNESPFPPPPSVAAASGEAAKGINFYNDPDCTALHQALAAHYGVTEDHVIATNGSDELLYLLLVGFCDADHPVALPDVTYAYYDLFCAPHRIPMHRIPLKDDLTVDPADYMHLGETILLANPNAPTGLYLSLDKVAAICEGNPDNVVIIDEAYIDFGCESALPLIEKYPNLFVTRTFSKSRSLAGARLGYGFACKALMDEVKQVHNAVNLYSVCSMTQAAGLAALKEDDYYMGNCRTIIAAREETKAALASMGFEQTDSLTNFLFARYPGVRGAYLKEELEKRHILVRQWQKDRIADYLRITVGTPEQMHCLTEALRDILRKGRN